MWNIWKGLRGVDMEMLKPTWNGMEWIWIHNVDPYVDFVRKQLADPRGKADAQPPGGRRSAPALRLLSGPSEEATLAASTRTFRSPKETFIVCNSAVFKAVRWLKSPGAFQPPPLQVDNVVYETQMDKANALRQATLERRTAEDDIANAWTLLFILRSSAG
ncbi:hypothetical protein FocnCong_v011493 [Fusarium oxysporum f. sp. conglutinans]|nr:hypothetical protein FocnCong_v011493 [Fusarium oxysporum f. sp. conglutinans]